MFRNVQRAAISENSVKLLAILNIYHDNWLRLTTEFGKLFYGSVDTLQQLTDYCEYLEK
ncbi:transposase [Shewanella xiamenensis]|nr:transposase [Shewanella xiamenensis]